MRRRTLVDPRFPARLRAAREERGLSLRDLAKKSYHSRSLLSEWERGIKKPTAEIALGLDNALEAGGELAALVTEPPEILDGDEADRLGHAAQHPRRIDNGAIDTLETLLAGQRRLEDTVGSGPMLDVVNAQLALVREMTRDAAGPLRIRLVDVAGQWAQFAGWLHIATEQHDRAAALLDRSLEWAMEAGDKELVATVLSFKGHAAWLVGEVGPLIGLTEAALRDPDIYVGQRAYDHHQLARGLALTGDRRAAVSTLDAGLDLAAATGEGNGAAPWHYYRNPAFFRMEAGLVHEILGRDDQHHNEQAISLLTDGLAGLPEDMTEAEWAAEYLAHLAASYLHAGDRERTEAALARLRMAAAATSSIRLRSQVSALSRLLSMDTSRTPNPCR